MIVQTVFPAAPGIPATDGCGENPGRTCVPRLNRLRRNTGPWHVRPADLSHRADSSTAFPKLGGVRERFRCPSPRATASPSLR
ncbi:hypothetical protein JCM3263A_01740 [Thermobifida fusca]